MSLWGWLLILGFSPTISAVLMTLLSRVFYVVELIVTLRILDWFGLRVNLVSWVILASSVSVDLYRWEVCYFSIRTMAGMPRVSGVVYWILEAFGTHHRWQFDLLVQHNWLVDWAFDLILVIMKFEGIRLVLLGHCRMLLWETVGIPSDCCYCHNILAYVALAHFDYGFSSSKDLIYTVYFH